MRTFGLVCIVCVAAAVLAVALLEAGSAGRAQAWAATRPQAPAQQAQPGSKPAPRTPKQTSADWHGALTGLTNAASSAEKTAGEAFKNVQLLKDVPAAQLMPAMFFIAASLGVGCEHCHVTAAEGPWPLEKDDKKQKQTAREMIKMMRAINDQYFGALPQVSCATCHQGHAEPDSASPIVPLGAGDEGEEEEEGAKKLPNADQVIEKYIQATGDAALGKLQTRILKGRLTAAGRRFGALEVIQKAPDHMLVTITYPSSRKERQGFDGKVAWQEGAGSVFEMDGVEKARLVHDAQFSLAAYLKARYPRRFVASEEKLGQEEVYVVRAGGPGDVSEKLYFGQTSGLLLRRIIYTKTVLGRFTQQTDYADYRESGGVKLPFTVRRMEVNTRWTESYSEVKHNVPVDDAVFSAPPGIK